LGILSFNGGNRRHKLRVNPLKQQIPFQAAFKVRDDALPFQRNDGGRDQFDDGIYQ